MTTEEKDRRRDKRGQVDVLERVAKDNMYSMSRITSEKVDEGLLRIDDGRRKNSQRAGARRGS